MNEIFHTQGSCASDKNWHLEASEWLRVNVGFSFAVQREREWRKENKRGSKGVRGMRRNIGQHESQRISDVISAQTTKTIRASHLERERKHTASVVRFGEESAISTIE